MAAKGLVARGVPTLPKWYLYIVGAIILLSVIILALAAYAQSLSGNYFYDSGVSGFLIFVSIWTWLVYGGAIAVERLAPQAYYRIGVFVGHVLSAIFWLTAWAWAASWASYTLSFDNYDQYDSIRGAWMIFGQVTAACAGLGALTWVLTIVVLVVFVWASAHEPSTTAGTNVELGNPSKQVDPVNPTTSTPADGYANQPVYGGEPSSAPQTP